MSHRSLLLSLSLAWTLLFLLPLSQGTRRWDYEPIFLESYSADESKLELTTKINRLPKGQFGFSGVLDFKYDVDDTTIVEAHAYRSPTGNDDDYKEMPWRIPKQTWTSFVKTFWDDIIVTNFANCTKNFPAEPLDPWPQIRLEFQTCTIQGEGLPEIAPQGFYKVVFTVVGEAEFGFVCTARVFDKLIR